MCRSALAGSRQVGAGSVALLAYPLQQLEAFRERDKKHYYGIRLKVGTRCSLSWPRWAPR